MYNPPSFRVDDADVLWSFMERHSFALLVTGIADAPVASHLPFLLERNFGPHGRLVGHLARANPQWRDSDGAPALVVFSGPHAYISPSWYEAKNVVPTWNYVAVHVTGRIKYFHDPAELLPLVWRAVDLYEKQEPNPWSLDSADPEFLAKLCEAIVGFTIDIETIEGKWKLSQNHDPQRRERVARRLEQRENHDSSLIAEFIRRTLPPHL